MNPIIPISICLPCFGRPQRTRRILENLATQTLTGAELLVVNDGCPQLRDLFSSAWFQQWRQWYKEFGNHLYLHQFSHTMGAYGAYAIHHCVARARGKFFCFANNDDMLLPEHLAFYYRSIATSGALWQYMKTMLVTDGLVTERGQVLKHGGIGHSELIIETELLKKIMKNRDFFNKYASGYGHDWKLVEEVLPYPHSAGEAPWPTYYIMGFGQEREQGID